MHDSNNYLIMNGLAMQLDPTPEEREILNQFLRGSNEFAD